MAMISTTLTSAITASQIQFGVTSTVGMPTVGTPFINQPLLIDSEFMFLVGVPAANTVIVRGRGSDGTAAVAHDTLANVYTSVLASDFGAIPPGIAITIDPTDDMVVSVGQDGAIPVPLTNTVFNINKATAAALTLGPPLFVDNGVTAVFTAQIAAAHVITATGLLMDGTAAAPKTTATFTAGKGATVTLVAENGFWNVSAVTGVTFA